MSPARNREQSTKEKSAFDLELASLKAEHNSEIAELQQKHDTLRDAALSIATQLDDDHTAMRQAKWSRSASLAVPLMSEVEVTMV